MTHPSLASFHPVVAAWFERTFGEPTPPQTKGWPLIADGENVLLLAPTGSGKTLAAFLKALDWLWQEAAAGRKIEDGVRVLYISPLKALNNDIYHNLELPLKGITRLSREMGMPLPELRTAVRTGDTPARERQRMLRQPPQILITTPESLFLLLSSQSRQILKTVRFVIVDEIHTLFPSKRGAHLALSLERLEYLAGSALPLQRIGLSATMRPLDQVAAFLGGNQRIPGTGTIIPRPVEVVDAGQRKNLDLKIVLPVPDLRELPERSIWPPLYRKLLELIKEHRTTLIFVNNRRLAERITANLNQLSDEEIARTHHGSVSREVRFQVEEMLKAGEIPCIVATASLELGIDIGFIDLVVQIESPKEVARGLQRVGRAGHVVGMPSKGRIIPKTRTDLLEAAVIVREMKAGHLETTRAPLNCLDILAQQIVAMTAEGAWEVEEVFRVACGAYNFRTLARRDFENVLGMLAGSFETEKFIELRPRLYWDRLEGVVRPDPYGKRLIYSSGGTIPDRGYFGVYLEGSGVRLGELDEEFVYERRLHERFVLGTSVWRIQEIRQDRVIVIPAKQGEAIVPFWKADKNGRPYELGIWLGAFLREIEERLETPELPAWLEEECALDREGALNLSQFLADQKKAVGFLQTDRRLVIEEFPDELGEWRVLLHSPFGAKIHTALGLLVKDDWEKRLAMVVEAIPTDDGVMFHCPGGGKPPEIEWDLLAAEKLEERIAFLISDTALFGTIFRHCAQRSLVMPRAGYGKKRNPLWLSRLKAGNLLQVVAGYRDFPLVIETYREILQDYFELDALQTVLRELKTGGISVHRFRHQTPSPFAHSHLFNFVETFMYEDDAPKGERRFQLFGLGRETLRTMVGQTGFRELFEAEVIQEVDRKARGLDLLTRELSLDLVLYWLERTGDLQPEELEELLPASFPEVSDYLEQLRQMSRVVLVRFGPDQRRLFISRPEVPVYLSALADAVPEYGAEGAGDEGLNRPSGWARQRLIDRYVRTHGPFQVADLVSRYGFPVGEVEAELARLAAEGLVEAGEFLPGGSGEEWCELGLLKEIQRRSLARARKEIAPRGPQEYAALLARRQGIGSSRSGLDGLVETLTQLTEVWLPASGWENTVLPGRMTDYRPVLLDQLVSSGQFIWRAKGSENRFRVLFQATLAEEDRLFPAAIAGPGVKTASGEPEILSSTALRVRDLLRSGGALSLPQILQQTALSSVTVWQALEELLLGGTITNDTFGPIRYLLRTRPEDRTGARGVLRPAIIAQMGRWSLLPPFEEEHPEVQAGILLKRYGLVCREVAQLEDRSWGELYPVYDKLESLGKVKRGYFVEGLSGIQYAVSNAVEQLRLPPGENLPEFWSLAWDDPANPLRIISAWPGMPEEIRSNADHLVFEAGVPVLSAGGRKLKIRTLRELTPGSLGKGLKKLILGLYPVYADEKMVVMHFNGELVVDTPAVEVLKELGFEKGYREMTLWPSGRKG
jgi:ATP-dependent helicase Lhr and Lhr-like helicase